MSSRNAAPDTKPATTLVSDKEPLCPLPTISESYPIPASSPGLGSGEASLGGKGKSFMSSGSFKKTPTARAAAGWLYKPIGVDIQKVAGTSPLGLAR